MWKILISIFALVIVGLVGSTPGQDIGVRGGGDSRPTPTPAPKRVPPKPAPTVKSKRQMKLIVVTDPSECEVYIDDSYRGTTAPDTGKLVVPGLESAKYTVRVYKRGVGQEVQTIDLENDQELSFSLKKETTEKAPEKQPAEAKPTEMKPTETKKPAEPAKPVEPSKPAPIQPPQSEMVFVPAGEFAMGINKGPVGYSENARPQHKVTVAGFYIDVYEVTNREYKLFCDATGRPYPADPEWDGNYFLSKPSNPVVNVTWNDANAYAQWVGKRLPTEEEWEKAARGADGRVWPWGKDYKPGLANLDGTEDGFEFTAPVGSFRDGVSPYGAYDMVGNVWEWTSSLYRPYSGTPDNLKDERYSKDFRVIRGGSFQQRAAVLSGATFRYASEPDKAYPATGFRCAK